MFCDKPIDQMGAVFPWVMMGAQKITEVNKDNGGS